MATTVSPDQIAYRKKIGHLGTDPVFEIGLIGGLHLITRGGSKEPLGAGPHRAVARAIAKKRNPEIAYTELNKGEWIDPSLFASEMPKYEELTDRLVALAREK